MVQMNIGIQKLAAYKMGLTNSETIKLHSKTQVQDVLLTKRTSPLPDILSFDINITQIGLQQQKREETSLSEAQQYIDTL